jgi:NADH dehydrogenase FAD-containing subunit
MASADLARRSAVVQVADGSAVTVEYDVLVVATGVTNGFWRRPDLQGLDEVDAGLVADHERLAGAGSVVVVGGGAAAVSCAANTARRWPDKRVDLYFPGVRGLPHHHARVWAEAERQLVAAGVGLHPGHRAELPESDDHRITADPVRWSTGQPPTPADAVVWAVGRVRPNTGWLPADALDEHGFVRVTPELRVVGHDGVFAIGDVAATDPLRSSARNFTHRLLAHNVRAHLEGGRLRRFEPPRHRWGSVLGPEERGLQIFTPRGRAVRVPRWVNDRVLQRMIVDRTYLLGVRRPVAEPSAHIAHPEAVPDRD